MLKFLKIANTDKQSNVIIVYENPAEIYAVSDGNFVKVLVDVNLTTFVETDNYLLPHQHDKMIKILALVDDKTMIDVWASGGEMKGYLDNNLSYFLDLDDAITHLQWQYDYLEYDLVDTDIELFAIDPEIIRQQCLDSGGSYMGYTADNWSYSIYKTSIRLIDYLLQELE